MEGKGYKDLPAFQGKMDAKNNQDPGFYRRAQYVKKLVKADYPAQALSAMTINQCSPSAHQVHFSKPRKSWCGLPRYSAMDR